MTVKSPKKLIEVALPLDSINTAAAREKSIRHGHPSTLHLWWARRPLAAARAVIFSQLVNDPSWKWDFEHPGEIPPNNLKASWAASRKRLFKIIEDLVIWENTTNEEVLEKAREEIRKSWRETCALNKEHPDAAVLFNPDKLPALHDPFAGGGAIPLEAQRLGLEAWASDLNPVAVLINKAMIEIPPKFAGCTPVGPIPPGEDPIMEHSWPGATGLAEDVRRYGAWMRAEAEKRIGHLYPKVEITQSMADERPDLEPLVGQKLTVIAWLWARTVKSPNPAFSHVDVPLVSSFILSSKVGKESYVQPKIVGKSYQFKVKTGTPPEEAKNGTSAGKRAAFTCLLSGVPIDYPYLREEGKADRLGTKLMAIVAEGSRGRIYLDPSDYMEKIAESAEPIWKPTTETFGKCRVNVGGYGLTTWDKLFTNRQLVALTTFSDLVSEAIAKCSNDARTAGRPDDKTPLDKGGTGATAYAEAVGVYLAYIVSRLCDFNSVICGWIPVVQATRNTFARQAIPMTWDFAELNIFGDWLANYNAALEKVIKPFQHTICTGCYSIINGYAQQTDAQTQTISSGKIISTDPPYYDNIGYADLSDFFYVWLRKSLKPVFPSLFSTIAVPKAEELVATPYRHGSKEKAEHFFLEGMTAAMHSLAEQAHPEMPVTIYYAFKQSETEGYSGTASTGWETFLEAVLKAGFSLTGTWPMRTELGNRMIGSGTNALASSIVLVCRKRSSDAPSISRREFIRELNAVLPEALDEMTKGTGDEQSPVAPVDLSQAIIGPGMAVFSKYSAVLESDGTPMSVRTALQLINRFLAEDDFDPDTQFCLHWFEQYGWKEGAFGAADVLARAKGTSVSGIAESGVVTSSGGNVRLLRPGEYPEGWDPEQDERTPVWETLHQLIKILRTQGETATGRILGKIAEQIEGVRQLAYRLYTLCERAGWAEDARAYNELMTSWGQIEIVAQESPRHTQGELF